MTIPLTPAHGAAERAPRSRAQTTSSASSCRVTVLYREHGPAIRNRCQRLLGDGAAAEDATHDVFFRVHRHLAHVPEGEGALPWLSRVATNLCLNRLRDRRRQGQLLSLTREPMVAARRTTSEAERLEARWLMERVPEKLRAAAWLRHVEDFEQQEIAELLGVSRRTVVYWLASFRRTLRQKAEAHASAAPALRRRT